MAQEAVECYERAVDLSRETESLHRLASLHHALGSQDAAARTYATLLELADVEGVCADEERE
jgi:predicted TPR repeat methyltransferase